MPANSRNKRLVTKLKNKEYRDAYVAANAQNGVAFQVRAMRQSRRWTQEELANRAGKKQNTISRLEGPSYGKMTLQTLIDLASAFDVALLVKFVPYSKFLAETQDVSPEALDSKSFEAELPSLDYALSLPQSVPAYPVILEGLDSPSEGAAFNISGLTAIRGYHGFTIANTGGDREWIINEPTGVH